MELKGSYLIAVEVLKALSLKEPSTQYELVKELSRNYRSVKNAIEFLELIGFVQVGKKMKGTVQIYEITLTAQGEKVKSKL